MDKDTKYAVTIVLSLCAFVCLALALMAYLRYKERHKRRKTDRKRKETFDSFAYSTLSNHSPTPII